MRYTQWQMGLIRAALRAHKRCYLDADGIGLGWGSIAEDIAELTGTRIPVESLRRFVEGANKKDNPLRYSVPDKERMAGIIAYLSHPEIDALSVEELKIEVPTHHAATRLRDYLSYKLAGSESVVPLALQGSYVGTYWREQFSYVTELHFEAPGEEALLLAHERSLVYDDAGRSLSTWSPKELESAWLRRDDASGWGLQTPEDNLLIFMKTPPWASNHYWSLFSEVNLSGHEPVSEFSLLRQDYPGVEDEKAFIVKFRRVDPEAAS